MPSYQEHLNRQNARNQTWQIIQLNILLYPALTAYLYLTFKLTDYTGRQHTLFYLLFIPCSLFAMGLIKRSFNPTDYWPSLSRFLLFSFLLLAGATVYLILNEQLAKIARADIYFAAFALLMSAVIFFRTEQSSKSLKTRNVSYMSFLIILAAVFSSFHFFNIGYLVVYPKSELTFQNTFISNNDISNFVSSTKNVSDDEVTKLINSPYGRTLRKLDIVTYNPGAMEPLGFSKEFQEKHMDIILKQEYGDQLKNYFWPVGYYCYNKSYYINDYFLKNIEVKHRVDYGDIMAIRLVFKSRQNTYFECTLPDEDKKDSLFTVSVKKSPIGPFKLTGHYHFKKSPDEVKGDASAITLTSDVLPANRISEFTYFKPENQKSDGN